MKRLVGGLVLLSLMSISLDKTAGETDITDKEVLDQLVNLRGFIDEQRDFTKASKGLKPVLVQYRSSASKIDGIVQCNLSFNTDALHLSIGGCSLQADGTTISILIKVVYKWTEYVGYTIKSATLTCSDTKVKVADVKNIDGEILSQLKCGDVVIKEESSDEHAYIVTYRGETGICLTYADASVVETQSYDLVDDEWVYNSEDKSILPINEPNASFKPIYCHPVQIGVKDSEREFVIGMLIFNNDATPFTFETLNQWINSLFTQVGKNVRIIITGYIVVNNVVYPTCYLYFSGTQYGIVTSPSVISNISITLTKTLWEALTPQQFIDGVNKIN